MKTLRLAAIVAALLPAQLLAQENPISYSYVGIGYLMGEIDASPTNVDTSGMMLEGSMEIANRGHLFALFGRQEFDDMEGVDTDMRALGGGVHFDAFDRFSVYGRLGFVDISTDVPFGYVSAAGSDDGLYLSGGVRYMVTNELELRGTVQYFDLDVSGEDELFSVGGDYYLTNVFALTFGVDHHDDVQTFKIGARIYPSKDRQARRR